MRTASGPRRIAVHLAAETIRVGRACGYEVEPIWGIAPQRFVAAAAGRDLQAVEADISRDAKSRGSGRPSMLQDVIRGRRTEIDFLNGYVVEQGKRVGIPTPFNETIVQLVHHHGVGTLTPDPKNLDPLLRMLP